MRDHLGFDLAAARNCVSERLFVQCVQGLHLCF
ncbi:Uncharacterised protein [Vibrio cholerae]|nr:Uncharacterised protein [Vibrio cholerae]CSI85358.1 Uncharacterised protein [Vibrio cholerae]